MSPRPVKPKPGEAPNPAPFLKWAGGKRQLLEQFARYLPRAGSYGTYHEPFLGGGAVFFRLLPRRAILSDTNAELIQCYETIRDDVEAVVAALLPCRNDETFFYQMRARDPGKLLPAGRAARMIYLNRTGYNGLYRVNRAGLFNVPFGRYESPAICNQPVLRAAAKALHGVSLHVEPFTAVLERARHGDFVYFDPPYQPLSTTSSFTAYTKEAFAEAEQRELARVFGELHKAGCRVMLSNSDTPLVRELYAEHRIEQVMANRAINSKSTGRGKIPEVLVLSWRGD